MDRGLYEKLSIRDSARSLKKYGSTSKHTTRNENCIKHFVTQTDTLQGIALKYDVTIEQIRRINRLWTSDSLFLKEFLLIPVSENGTACPQKTSEPPQDISPISPTSISNSSFDDDNVEEFLGKIDAAIANTKKEVKKTQKSSEFASYVESDVDKRKMPIARMKKSVNNNSTDFPAPTTVVVQQGRKIKTSLRQHERQQDELFEL